MELAELSLIEQEIVKALEACGEKSRFSEAVIAKKIRERAGIEGKKKAGISLVNLENAIEYLEEAGNAHFAIILNSANDVVVEKVTESRPLSQEAHSRRIRSERSMELFTNSDLSKNKNSKPKKNPQKKSKKPDYFDDDLSFDLA